MINIDFKELRQERGISQADVCRTTGLTQTTISRLENGHIEDPSSSTVVKYLDAIGLELDIIEK